MKYRKRAHPTDTQSANLPKRVKIDAPTLSRLAPVEHPTLSLYYLRTETLRCYLQSHLPAASRSRHRRLAIIGRQPFGIGEKTNPDKSRCSLRAKSREPQNEACLAALLDTTLVCSNHDTSRNEPAPRYHDSAAPSRQTDQIGSSSSHGEGSLVSISEVRNGFSFESGEIHTVPCLQRRRQAMYHFRSTLADGRSVLNGI